MYRVCWFFGGWENLVFCFRNLLTFRRSVKRILSKATTKIFNLKTFGKKNGHDFESVLKIDISISKNVEMIIIFLGSGTHPQLACNHCTRSKLQNSLKKSRKRTLQQRQPI